MRPGLGAGLAGGATGNRHVKALIEQIRDENRQMFAHLHEMLKIVYDKLEEQEKAIKDIQDGVADLYLTSAESNNKNEED